MLILNYLRSTCSFLFSSALPLLMHLARHTFATEICLTQGVPIESVSKMLGHTNIQTTQIYARVVDRKLSHDMAILEQKLQSKGKRAIAIVNP